MGHKWFCESPSAAKIKNKLIKSKEGLNLEVNEHVILLQVARIKVREISSIAGKTLY